MESTFRVLLRELSITFNEPAINSTQSSDAEKQNEVT
jgi:hypothetical protein